MIRNEIKNEYFDWMYGMVCESPSYRKLLHFLHDTEFSYRLPMDGNRYEDGVNLRYRFGYEMDHDSSFISDCLDDGPCSVLEMLIALSLRIEEHIMDDPEIGNRLPEWFWSMIENLGLINMTDDLFHEEIALETINTFLNNEYEPDGDGGLFFIPNAVRDLRNVEIWYQACWYLNSLAEKR